MYKDKEIRVSDERYKRTVKAEERSRNILMISGILSGILLIMIICSKYVTKKYTGTADFIYTAIFLLMIVAFVVLFIFYYMVKGLSEEPLRKVGEVLNFVEDGMVYSYRLSNNDVLREVHIKYNDILSIETIDTESNLIEVVTKDGVLRFYDNFFPSFVVTSQYIIISDSGIDAEYEKEQEELEETVPLSEIIEEDKCHIFKASPLEPISEQPPKLMKRKLEDKTDEHITVGVDLFGEEYSLDDLIATDEEIASATNIFDTEEEE